MLSYVRAKDDARFARKDEIAEWTMAHRDDTPVVERGPVSKTGLPGPAC